MPNEKNLTHKLTVEELRKGGRNSGKSRREKKIYRELAETMLSAKIKDKDLVCLAESYGVSEPDNKEMLIIGLIHSAIKGNYNAFDRLMKLCGEDTTINTGHNELIKAIKNRNKKPKTILTKRGKNNEN